MGTVSGWFRRFRFWLYRYDVEVGIGALVMVVSWKMLSDLPPAGDGVFTVHQSFMVVLMLLLLFVATVIMSNVARVRVAVECLVEVADDAKKR